MGMLRHALGLSIVLSLVAGCSGDDTASTDDTVPGDLPFGAECTASSECETNACLQVSAYRSICSGACDLDAPGDSCPESANWMCAPAETLATGVCLCQSDSNVEICGDELDNDCDGRTDDCMRCGDLVVPRNDPRHCGQCGRRCVPGVACIDGECACDGDPEQCELPPDADECDDADDCGDGVDCTDDACVFGRCVHTVAPFRCGSGEVCDLRLGGCVAAKPCVTHEDCRDDDPCTTEERCASLENVCLWVPLDVDGDKQTPLACGGSDCDDGDGNRFVGFGELCNGIDDDCDGVIDMPIAPGVCAQGESCRDGACDCAEGYERCDGTCIDVQSDPAHCGGCESACQPGVPCRDGECACPNSQRVCADGCADLSDDRDHCGACEIACDAGFSCEQGRCADFDECAAELDSCDDNEECVNVDGGWTCPCKTGYVRADPDCVDADECALGTDDCAAGACVNTLGGFDCVCPPGYAGDGHTCQDVDECETIDCGDHGQCDNSVGGFACICDPGYDFDGVDSCAIVSACEAGLLLPEQKWCSGGCRNVQTNPNHCGDCGHACGVASVCTDGDCACSSATHTYCQSVGCFDLDSDRDHCGDCDDACPSDALACADGACVCPDGELDCGGSTCTPVRDDEANCGSCGRPCDVVCAAGDCATALETVAGEAFSCARLSDGGVQCWGSAASGALGNGASSGVFAAPAAVAGFGGDSAVGADKLALGYAHACVVGDDASLHCWGENNAYQTRQTTTADQLVPFQVRSSGVSDVALGRSHTCIVANNGTIACVGLDENGQHGDGDSVTPSSTASGPGPDVLRDVDELVSGYDHLCARKDGMVYCWGYNYYGEVGIGTSGSGQDVHAPTLVPTLSGVTDLSAHANHSCAVAGGQVLCWGRNDGEQLGVAGGANQSSPVPVPGITTAVAVATGTYHSCALLDGGTVTCWGQRTHGQTGSVPTSGSSATPSPVSGGGVMSQIAAGGLHSCGLAAGDVLCWGAGATAATGMTSDTGTPTAVNW